MKEDETNEIRESGKNGGGDVGIHPSNPEPGTRALMGDPFFKIWLTI
jgi:hypothetical protein